jgi:hypothetical protein
MERTELNIPMKNGEISASVIVLNTKIGELSKNSLTILKLERLHYNTICNKCNLLVLLHLPCQTIYLSKVAGEEQAGHLHPTCPSVEGIHCFGFCYIL